MSLAGKWWRTFHYRGELIVLVVLLAVALLASELLSDSLPFGIASLGVVSGFGVLLHAIGVILVYRTGQFVNFAQVQIGMVGAALFTSFVHGDVLPRLLDSVCGGCVGPNPSRAVLVANFLVAVVLGLAFAVLVSVTVYVLVVQRFANQPKLVLTIATIFVAQTLIAIQRGIGGLLVTEDQLEVERVNPYGAAPPPWQFDIQLPPAQLRIDGMLTIAVGLLAVVVVAAYLRYSRTGVAVRAAAENGARARTLGINTIGVTARIWVIVGLLSGAGGILTAFGSGSAGSTDSDVVVLPVRMLVLVLAVAVVARFSSLTMAAIAAVVFGVLQEAAVWSMSSTAPLEAGFVVIIGALLLFQRRKGNRADSAYAGGWQGVREVRPIPRELRSIPVVRAWTRTGGVLLAVVVFGLPWVLSPSQTNVAGVHLAYVVIGMSLLVLTGWAGQVSLGQFGFAALGAWVAAAFGLPLIVAIPLAGLAGALVAVLVGLPALKLRGLELAIMTLAFAVSATTLFVTTDYLGASLRATMPRASLFGIDVSAPRTFYYVTLVLTIASVVAVLGLRRSRTGRALIGARDNEAAVASYGIDVVRARLTAFAFSGFLAAMAGAILAYAYGSVTPAVFPPETSITLFAFTVIGGLGAAAGPVVGMVYLFLLTLLGANEFVQALGSGLVGLLVLAALPGGFARGLYDVRDALLRRVAARHRIVVPSLSADRDPTTASDQAPLDEKRHAGFVPQRFEPSGQWALHRYGADEGKERVGG